VGSITGSWTEEHTQAFDTLWTALVTVPILISADLRKKFTVTADWQPFSIAGVLTQLSDGVEQIIACGSKKLSGAEANWSAAEGE